MHNHRYLKIFISCFALQLISIFYLHAQDSWKVIADSLRSKYTSTEDARVPIDSQYFFVAANDMHPIGLRIIRKFNEYASIAQITKPLDLQIRNLYLLEPANLQWKFSSNFLSLKTNDNEDYIVSVQCPEMFLQTIISSAGKIRLVQQDKTSSSFVINTTRKVVLNEIAPLFNVYFIDKKQEAKAEISIIGYNRSFHGINAVDYSIPGANGKNMTTGVKEQKMDENDIDLFKRVLPSSLAANTTSNHATVISSIIGGAGNSFYDGRGIAWRTQFFPSTFANLFADDAAILNTNKVFVQNHSYGTIIQQFYGAEALSYDMQTWSNKNLLHVFSAGNQGDAVATDGPYHNLAGYANITGNFKMAKNVITVGAIDNKGIVPVESSAGPLYDGRIAPQLIALGPNGTSDAAAVVSGTATVMQQVYSDSNSNAIPPASLIKAILYNTADDIFRSGIDYKTGYGLLNGYNAIRSLQQKEFDGSTITQGQTWTRSINIPANAALLKLTLSWTDTASLLNNNKALSNDLDLELVQQSTALTYQPWVLSAVANVDSLAKSPLRKRDSLNTAEQISIQQPTAGSYLIRVNGTSIISPAVPFNVAWHVDTLNTFRFTSPQHTSDVNREENPLLDIRWKTFVADTNQTGNLFISYDAGITWQLIRSNYKIYTNYYQWPIKDTNSRALFRMQTTFGDFYSKEFVIAKVTRPKVDFACIDSFRLSWNRHVYANSYKIYALIDSPYLKPIISVADTFMVFNRAQYPYLVYAIEPILNNGLPASRSQAFNINFQGTQCFYHTFYSNLLDENKLDLVLELSAPSYVDSLIFEQVTAGGQLIRVVGRQNADDLNFLYHQLVSEVPKGNSYWRVTIRLKSGAVILTNIISILTSGQRYIVFYPNPVTRSGTLNYVLRQGTAFESRLQLFDGVGRLIRDYTELPGTINTSLLPQGLMYYRLTTKDGVVLETGKLIIH
jgi:hypothetical protein